MTKEEALLRQLEARKMEIFLIEHVLRHEDFYREVAVDPTKDTFRQYVKDNPDKVLMWGAILFAFLLGYALG